MSCCSLLFCLYASKDTEFHVKKYFVLLNCSILMDFDRIYRNTKPRKTMLVIYSLIAFVLGELGDSISTNLVDAARSGRLHQPRFLQLPTTPDFLV